MKPQINIVHGFLESQDSNWAGLHALIATLQGIFPTANISEYQQNVFDSVPFQDPKLGPEMDIGNSWGGSAIIRRVDKLGGRLAGTALFDPVTNGFNQPVQDGSKEWIRRANIGHILCFREVDSILHGPPLRPGNLEMFTGQYDAAQKFLRLEYGWGTDIVFDSGSFGENAFMEHFELMSDPKHAWVQPEVIKYLQEWVDAWVPPTS